MNWRGEEADCIEKVLGHIRVECHWDQAVSHWISSSTYRLSFILLAFDFSLKQNKPTSEKVHADRMHITYNWQRNKEELKGAKFIFSRAIKQIKTKIKKKMYTGTLKKNWREFLFDLENYMAPLRNSLLTFYDALSALHVVCSVCLRYSIEGIVWPRWLWLKGELCRARVVLKEAAGGRGRAGFSKGLPQSTGRLRIVQVL